MPIKKKDRIKKYLLFFCIIFSCSAHDSFGDSIDSILKNSTLEVEKAGNTLNDFSDYISRNFNKTFSFINNVSQCLDIKHVPFSSTEGIWAYLGPQLIQSFLVILLTIIGFFVVQRFTFYVWLHHPIQKGMNIQRGDYIFFYIVPWVFFLIFGNFFANIFCLFPLLKNTLISIFFIVATIFPIRKITLLSYGRQYKNTKTTIKESLRKVAPSFIYRRVMYLVSLGIFCIGLIGFFSFIAPVFLYMENLTELLYNHLNKPATFLSEKISFYFYVLNLIWFFLALERFTESKEKLTIKKMNPLRYYWSIYGKYWFQLTKWFVAVSFGVWLVVDLHLLSHKMLDIFLSISAILLLISSYKITETVVRYIACRLTEKIVSSKLANILNAEKLFCRIGYSIYYFICFCFFLYLAGFHSFLLSIKTTFFLMVEKVLLISLILFVTVSFKSFLLTILQKILSNRSKKEIVLRSGNRLYTFLTLFKALIPPLLWTPALVLIFILLGISGKVILMLFAASGAILVFVGQNVMQDMIKGIMYMLEDVVVIGEEVTINGIPGHIERLSLHSVSVRDFGGLLHTFSFGKIASIASSEWRFVNVVIEVKLDYQADLEKAIHLMEKVIKDMKKHPKEKNLIVGETLEIFVEDLIEYCIYIKARIKTVPGNRKYLKTVYYRHLIQEFQKNQINIAHLEPPTGSIAKIL